MNAAKTKNQNQKHHDGIALWGEDLGLKGLFLSKAINRYRLSVATSQGLLLKYFFLCTIVNHPCLAQTGKTIPGMSFNH